MCTSNEGLRAEGLSGGRLVEVAGPGRVRDGLRAVDSWLAGRASDAEQFMSDIHGDSEAFRHLVRSASGEVRALVEGVLEGVDDAEGAFDATVVNAVCAALYYPECFEGAISGAFGGSADLFDLAAKVRAHCTGRFHLLGDIWDRGGHGDDVMDALMSCPSVDVQWGNHDVCWMGAAAGDPVCISTCLRNNIKYGNTDQFEIGYGIDLNPLREFAVRTYGAEDGMSPLMKAISALLFKCEGQAILRHPEWHMEDRLLWGRIDLGREGEASVDLGGTRHPLKTADFPTFDPGDPYALSAGEAEVMTALVDVFRGSERLQRQVGWLYDNGSVYKVAGDFLLFHGCVPLEADGSFAAVNCGGVSLKGKALLDWVDGLCRRAWGERDQWALDWMGYLWCGWQSTFAGRVVKTFERTYIEDKSTWVEPQDPYYALTKGDPAPCEAILAEFGIDGEKGVIVNGHTPVKLPKGELPVRGGGRRLVIDGGMCPAYRKTTGIAGYTLVRNGDRLSLVAHGEFPGMDAVLAEGADSSHEVEVIR